MNSVVALMSLLAMGADPDVATKFSKDHFVQGTKILISRAEVSRLNQGQLLSYFPYAGFFFKKHLRNREYQQNVKGHFTIDLRDILQGKFENAIVATAAVTGHSNEEVVWSIKKEDVVKYLTARKVPISIERSVFPTASEDSVKISLMPKAQGSYFYMLPRLKKESSAGGEPTFNWDAPNESTLVEFDIGDNSTKLTSLLSGVSGSSRSQFLQDHGLNLDIKDDGEWTTAWNSGEFAFSRHYDTHWLSGTVTYQGPDAPTEGSATQSFGEFVVAISRPMQQQGFLVIPKLVNPETPKNTQLSQLTPVPIYEASSALEDRTRQGGKRRVYLQRLELDATTFISTIVTPSILRTKKGTLQCSLPAEGDGQTIKSACFRRDSNFRIVVVPDAENRFWVTDSTEIPSWQIDLKVLKERPKSMQIQGEFYPVQSKGF